jgi:tetratricopeptide repeat protein
MIAAQYREPAQLAPVRDPTLQRGLDFLHAGRLAEAEFSLTAALARDPAGFEPLHFLAVLRSHQGRRREALDLVNRALRQRPRSAEALALQDGLRSHLTREQESTASGLCRIERPCWDGHYVAGTLRVSCRQGLGEQILYASMLPDLATRASRIVVEVEPRLVDLFTRSFPGLSVRANAARSDSGEPDPHVPMARLARHLRPSRTAFPRREEGFLMSDQTRAAALRRRIAGDGRVVVGLSWKSRNSTASAKAKSARLLDFAAVLKTPNCRFIDLQHSDTRAECAAVAQELGVHVERLGDVDNRRDIDGLAALVTACDIVVSVSNATAHLAGALGRPTWAFVPNGWARPWYWFEQGDDSPWYPHLRIRRQAQDQSWADLITSCAEEIW